MHKFLAAAAMTAAMVTAGGAYATPLAEGGVSAQDIAAILQAKGYKAEITKDRQGDPLIKSAADGANFEVVFYDCKNGRCHSVQFGAAYDLPKGMTLKKVNTWNADRRFGNAFLDKVDDPYIQMDVDLGAGASTELLDHNVEAWLQVHSDFQKFIDEE